MKNSVDQDGDHHQIELIIENRTRAVREKNVALLMTDVSPEIVSFDVVNPLQYSGRAEVQKRAEQWFSSFQTNIQYEVREVNISVSGSTAFSHCLSHVQGTNTTGMAISMWFRTTLGYTKADGKWLVSHEHSSVPFDGESGKASLDLKPE